LFEPRLGLELDQMNTAKIVKSYLLHKSRQKGRLSDDDHSHTYRACPIKRPRRTRAAIDGIKQTILNVISDDPPMTVRQVFYQLVARGVIEKTDREYQQTVIRLMTDMRIADELPFEWVIDESRRRRITQTFESISNALECTAKFYRRSALGAAGDYLEIWCEKDALSGLLWEVTSRFSDGRVAEIFLQNHKVGSQSDTNARDAALAASLAFQHGCTLDVLRAALLRDVRGRATTSVALDLLTEQGTGSAP
jgi:hypothetical protein